jgi:hypothetical protein
MKISYVFLLSLITLNLSAGDNSKSEYFTIQPLQTALVYGFSLRAGAEKAKAAQAFHAHAKDICQKLGLEHFSMYQDEAHAILGINMSTEKIELEKDADGNHHIAGTNFVISGIRQAVVHADNDSRNEAAWLCTIM